LADGRGVRVRPRNLAALGVCKKLYQSELHYTPHDGKVKSMDFVLSSLFKLGLDKRHGM
jgi:hypothetical protein